MTKRAVLLLLLVGLLALASCGKGLFGDELPSDVVVVKVDLPPGDNETYEFEFEVEVTGLGHEEFSVYVVEPAPFVLDGWGTHKRSWVADSVGQVGWPDVVIVESGEVLAGELYLNLSNDTQSRIEERLTVKITAEARGIPAPTEETLKLAIRQR